MTEIATIAINLLKWIWGHKTLAALIAVSIFAAIQTSRLATRTIERDSAKSRIEAAEQKEAVWKARSEADSVELKHVRDQLDALDARAKEQQALSDKAVADLSAERDAALSKAETFRTELERKAREPGATAVSVGRAALEGLRN